MVSSITSIWPRSRRIVFFGIDIPPHPTLSRKGRGFYEIYDAGYNCLYLPLPLLTLRSGQARGPAPTKNCPRTRPFPSPQPSPMGRGRKTGFPIRSPIKNVGDKRRE